MSHLIITPFSDEHPDRVTVESRTEQTFAMSWRVHTNKSILEVPNNVYVEYKNEDVILLRVDMPQRAAEHYEVLGTSVPTSEGDTPQFIYQHRQENSELAAVLTFPDLAMVDGVSWFVWSHDTCKTEFLITLLRYVDKLHIIEPAPEQQPADS